MNFDPYQEQGKLNGPASNQDKINVLNGGAVALEKANAQGGDIISKGISLAIQEHDNMKALDANNYYNQLVSQGIMKIKEGKEENALDALNKFNEMEQKAYAQTKKKYGKSLYGRTGAVFENARAKDINNRRQQMEQYQVAEEEKYKNNVLTNLLNTNMVEAAENINDPDTVSNAFGKMMAGVEGRFWKSGPEKIKLEQGKIQNLFAETLMQTALNNGDVAAANRIYAKYGSNMDPNKKSVFGKSISNLIREDRRIVDVDGAIAAANGDPEVFGKLLESLADKADHGDVGSLIAAAKAEEGKQYGSNDCAPWVMRMARKFGYKFDDDETWVPTMVKKAKADGRHFTDPGQLADGDIVVMETNNNPNDGSDHVGIYDAKRNMIIQSGTNGVSAYSMDQYPITGYIKMKSDPERQSPAKRKKYIDEGWAQWKQKQYQANNMADQKYDDFLTEAAGAKDLATLQTIATKYHSNDPQAEKILRNKIDRTVAKFKEGKSSNPFAGSGKVSTNAEKYFEQARLNGTFPSDKAMTDYAYSFGDPEIIAAADKVKAKSQNKEGSFSFSFGKIKDDVMFDYPGKATERDQRWKGICNEAYEWIESFRVQNGRPPTNQEVKDHCRESVVNGRGDVKSNGILGDKTSDSLRLYDIPVVKWYTSVGNNRFRVMFRDAATPVVVDGNQVAEIVGGKDWKEVVGDAAPRK